MPLCRNARNFPARALGQTLLTFEADYQVESIKPKAFRPPEDCSKRGEMSRRILDILRKAAPPMTTRDIGLQMLADRQWT